MAYDSKLRPLSTAFLGADVTNRDFITSDRVARMEPNRPALASLGRRLEYGSGRVYSQWELPGPADLGRIFGYDKLGRLAKDTAATVAHDTCVWDPGFGWRCPNPTVDSVVTYTYDPAGNVTSAASSTGYSETGSYGTANRIQDFGGCTYTTASDGPVTQRTCGATVTDFWWSSEGRLDSLQHAGTKIRHAYDGNGRLVRREVGSTTRYFLWHGDHVFAELDANGTELVEYSYYPGMDRPHAIGIADSVYFHHTDGLGNVIGLVKDDQALRAQYTYSLRGDATWNSEDLSGQTNRARFKGALRFGEETELYYMRNRWYEPETGRFLSEDPIGLAGGINVYVYAGNNPIGGRDPTGLCGDEETNHDGTPCPRWDGAGGWSEDQLEWFETHGSGALVRSMEAEFRRRFEEAASCPACVRAVQLLQRLGARITPALQRAIHLTHRWAQRGADVTWRIEGNMFRAVWRVPGGDRRGAYADWTKMIDAEGHTVWLWKHSFVGGKYQGTVWYVMDRIRMNLGP